ncbi:uncharacterized protein METZ01_LOCUS400337 [marine metagenome]|uniref:Alanine racemase N-terminal domain-containing protein n=1 Tax=marine metagenome TaxID=408172 RepID=A0A382VLX4_9ZZZZ
MKQLAFIQNKINEIINRKQLKTKPEIVVVSKTFPLENIMPLLDHGHIHYGENKIQEAEDKWSEIKKNYKNLQLHMVGKLQTNKVKKAVKLFDYVHSLDSERLALKISQYQKELNKEIKLFIQVNLGGEKQKSGLALNNLHTFYNYCVNELSLNIIGLMCLPPIDSDSVKYFKLLKKIAENFNLKELSMGMSSDFEDAVINGSTFLRLGTLILGKRNII